MSEANRHVVCFTAENRWTGKTFSDQFPEVIIGTAADAEARLGVIVAELEARLAQHAELGFEPGHGMSSVNMRSFRLHSWHQGPPLPWGPPPLSGPGWDEAWINGPGSDAA